MKKSNYEKKYQLEKNYKNNKLGKIQKNRREKAIKTKYEKP